MKSFRLSRSMLALLIFFYQGRLMPVLALDSLQTKIIVTLEDMPLYTCVAADSAAAAAEASRIRQRLAQMQTAASQPEKLRLAEKNGYGVLLLDSSCVILVKPEHRINPQISPLANALNIRDWLVAHAIRPPWDEEELLLRLLLGVVFPFSLMVMLRLTRLGLMNWERDWRRAALQWFVKQADQRGIPASSEYGKRLVHILLGFERLIFFSAIVILVSFGWFTLFPQTRSLASSLIARIVGPALSLLGDTVRALLTLVYIVVILWLVRSMDHQLMRRRKGSEIPEIFQDPLIYFPLRLSIWIMAFFLILFPFPGAPRMFALGALFIMLIAGLLALRPIIEEMAAGVWIGRQYQLTPGEKFVIGNQEYTLVTLHLVHLLAEYDKQLRFIPYSKILKSEFSLLRKTE